MSGDLSDHTPQVGEQVSWNPALRPDSDVTAPGGKMEEEEQVDSNAAETEADIETPTTSAILGSTKAEPDVQPELPQPELPPNSETTILEEHQSTRLTDDGVAPSSPVESGDEWNAGERIDPAWGLQSTSAGLSHTNSFPPVPPLSASLSTPVQPLSHSQAEDIMEDIEGEDDDFETRRQTEHSSQDVWDDQGENKDEEDFFSKVNDLGSSVPVEPSDTEARYEEGVPLVQHDAESSEVDFGPSKVPGTQQANDTFEPSFGEEEDNDDFFSKIDTKKPEIVEPPSLDRKSTMQVMSSMEFAPHSANHEMENPINNNLPEKGVEEHESSHTATNNSAATDGASATKEADLAALWEAALGDDELLEEDTVMDPGSFFEDDGEGFLEDAPHSTQPQATVPGSNNQPTNSQAPALPRQTSAYQPSNPYAPAQSQQRGQMPSQYAPGASSNFINGMGYGQPQQLQRPPMSEKAQSFADKSKGGYSSPFDAPMDLSRPKRRPAQFQSPPTSAANRPPPPPRSSSIQSPDFPPSNQPTPPSSAMQAPLGVAGATRPQLKGSATSFFEELPMLPKPRPSTTTRYSQQPAQPTPPPSRGMHPGPPPMSGPPVGAPVQQYNYGLVSPTRVAPFSDSPQQSGSISQGSVPPAIAPPKTAPPPGSRYSPAPGAQQQDQNRNRYAAAGGPPVRPPSVTLPHQPRTSSPLTRSASATNQYMPQAQAGTTTQKLQSPPSTYGPSPAQATSMQPFQGPPMGVAPPRSNYAQPQNPYASIAQEPASIPRPTITQRGPVQEPATVPPYPIQQASAPLQRTLQPRGPSLDVNFIPPSDGNEHDPLKRWQGAPIFKFGFGGNITVSFPQRIPRFSSGQAAPMIKCSPGVVKVESARTLPIDEHLAAFPGPLKAKGKKKEVLEWLQRGIQRLEQQHIPHIPQESPVDVRKRQEEKILLWKLLAVMVEHDGSLEGNPVISKAIRDILSPELSFDGPANQTSYTTSMLPTGITANSTFIPQQVAGVEAVENIRKLLLQGEREQAVWLAVDKRLWGHAMLIASTMQPEIRKQVAQEFVKTDVKPIGDNTEPLAALYDVFSGNWEECVDRLVPPSARAGLQMVSKTAMSGPAKNAFEGLDRWRETLSLVLGNRSMEDGRSMIALGQLLSTYGRMEAAHICYMFSGAPGLFGGAENPQAYIVLLGADHRHQPFDYARDVESVLLSEVYDFALSILSSSAPPAGHLQPFKLYHATVLADHGLRDEALRYCDVIANSQKANTKVSPYYHGRLFAGLEDLSARLRQAPKEGSGSWIPKPSMDKVSSSIFNRFTSFVAGDDSDAASVGSAQHDAQGPFAKINGDTPPTLSRSGSPSEGYGYGTGYAPPAPVAPVNSRYAPGNNAYSPRASLEQQQSLNRRPSQLSMQSSSPDLSRSAYGGYHPSSLSQATPPSQGSYSPEVPSQSRLQSSTLNSVRPQSQDSQGPVSPPPEVPRMSPYEPRRASYQSSPSSSYEPPPTQNLTRAASYAPRSYQPSPAADKPLPSAPASEATSYEPQAPNPDILSTSSPQPMLQTPTISHEPPTPVKPTHETATYGFEPSPLAEDNPEIKEETNTEPDVAPGYQPPTTTYEPPSGYEPPTSSYFPPVDENSASSSYEPPASSYEPPTSSYEPPSYQPYQPETNGEANDAPSSPIKKKKSFMDLSDDEDSMMPHAAALKKDKSAEKTKSEKDREAEEAFRRAAEADAAKDKQPQLQSKGSGWLGGWFSKNNAPAPDLQPKAIKAKLGDESSFYFDKNLGKWVNKNAPDSATPSAPTPPPPRAPPSRSVSTSSLGASGPMGMRPPTSAPSGPPMGGPPTGPASRNVSPSLGSTPPGPSPLGMTPSGLVPPSRPGTGMSTASTGSIDDLIGVPQARKGGTMKGKKKRSGYVDIMAKD